MLHKHDNCFDNDCYDNDNETGRGKKTTTSLSAASQLISTVREQVWLPALRRVIKYSAQNVRDKGSVNEDLLHMDHQSAITHGGK